MASKTLFSSPNEKQSSDKCNSSTSFTDVTLSKITLRAQKSKRESKKNRLAIVSEEPDSQNYSFSFPKEENSVINETNSNSDYVVKNKKKMKTDEGVFKKSKKNTGLEALFKENYYLSNKEEQQTNENIDSSHTKPKKHKKHKNLDKYVEPENDTVIVSSRHSKEKTKKSTKHKNKTVGAILNNKSDMEGEACKMDSRVNIPKDGRPLKRKSSLSQSYLDHNTEHSISDDNGTTYCSTKSSDKSKLFHSHKKSKRKFRSINNFGSENNVVDCKFGENEQPILQNQETAEFSESRSYLEPNMENCVSLDISSNLVSPKNKKSYIYERIPISLDSKQSPGTKYQENETHISQGEQSNTSFMSKKKPKKQRQSFSNFEVYHLATASNENYHCDVNEPNTSEEALVEPYQKYKLSLSSVEVLDKTSTTIGKFSSDLEDCEPSQNIPKTKAKQKTLEMGNEFCSQKMKTEKVKARKNKSKNFKAVNISNSAIPDVRQNQKDFITETLNNESPKSVKNNESILAEGGRINIKPNDTPSAVKVNPTTKRKVKHAKSNVLLNKSLYGNFDIDKVQRDLLAAALKSINKSPKSLKTNRSNKNVKKSNYKDGKPAKAINISNSAIPDVRQNQKDFITETLNKESPKSIKNNESIYAECDRIHAKPIDTPSAMKINPTTKQQTKHAKAKVLLKESSCGNFDIDKVQRDLLAAALKSLNKSPKSHEVTRSKNNFKERKCKKPFKKTKKEDTKIISKSRAIHESNSALQSKIVQCSNMPDPALSQPSTSKDVGIIGKSDKTHKTKKLKPKVNQDGKLDIEKIQQQLLAAALKKVKSEPTESKTSVNPELHQGSKITPSKEEKRAKLTKDENQAMPNEEVKQAKGNEIIAKPVKKVKKDSKTGLKNKSKAKSNPFEDFTAKLLSAELAKRNKGV